MIQDICQGRIQEDGHSWDTGRTFLPEGLSLLGPSAWHSLVPK